MVTQVCTSLCQCRTGLSQTSTEEADIDNWHLSGSGLRQAEYKLDQAGVESARKSCSGGNVTLRWNLVGQHEQLEPQSWIPRAMLRSERVGNARRLTVSRICNVGSQQAEGVVGDDESSQSNSDRTKQTRRVVVG